MSTTSKKREATGRRAIFPCRADGCKQRAIPGMDYCPRCHEELEAEIERLKDLVNYRGQYRLARTQEARRILVATLVAVALIVAVAVYANLTA